jgi:CubicO group peptidase (beta-lactamase class C family)
MKKLLIFIYFLLISVSGIAQNKPIDKQLQTLIDDFRIKSGASAVVMSIGEGNQPIESSLTQRLFKPLELKNTFYLPYAYPQFIMKRMAHGYGYTYLAGEFSPPNKVGTDMTRFNLSMGGAAGAMVSNTHDLVKWSWDCILLLQTTGWTLLGLFRRNARLL